MMTASSSAFDDVFDDSRRLRYVLAAWAVAALVILVQGVAEQAVERGTVTTEFLLRWRLYPVALWAAATPLVLAAALRWPLAGRWLRDLAVHSLLFGGWMVTSNALLRIPDLLAGRTDGFGHEVVAAAIEYAPTGALVWGVLVLIGRAGRGTEARAGAGAGARDAGRSARKKARRSELALAPEPDALAPQPADAANGGDRRSAIGDPPAPLALREGERTWLVPRESVRWVEADGDYLRVHAEDRVHRIRGPMKAFHRELGDGRFLRIHRSTLVNVTFIREIQPFFHGDWIAILRDGTRRRTRRARRAAIRRLRGESPAG